MANQISNDGLLTNQAVTQRKTGTHPGEADVARQAPERHSPRSTNRADIGPARQRLSQESKGVGEAAITSANEARRQLILLREQLSNSPASAVKAHSAMTGDIFEAAMTRPVAP